MSVMIQIRNVPDEIHRTLKARAAESGVTLSELLLREARQIAERPSDEEMRRRLAELKPINLGESSAQIIRKMRDERSAVIEKRVRPR